MINLVKTTLKFKTKEDALKLHLYAISVEGGIKLSSADIEVAVEIYNSGYTKDLFKTCVTKGYFKSEQTVRNSVAKLTKHGILEKQNKGKRKVSESILPFDSESDFVFTYNVIYDIKNAKRSIPSDTQPVES